MMYTLCGQNWGLLGEILSLAVFGPFRAWTCCLAQRPCWPMAARQRALGRCCPGSVRARPVAAWAHRARGPACQPVRAPAACLAQRALAAWHSARAGCLAQRACSLPGRWLPAPARAHPTVDLHSAHTRHRLASFCNFPSFSKRPYFQVLLNVVANSNLGNTFHGIFFNNIDDGAAGTRWRRGLAVERDECRRLIQQAVWKHFGRSLCAAPTCSGPSWDLEDLS